MRFLVRKLDEFIRRSNRVFEFCQDANCMLRLQVTHASHTLQLPNLIVETGDQVLLIHLWNERLSPLPIASTDLAWASHILHLFVHSLCLVASYLSNEPELNEIRAVGGVTILLTTGLHEAGSRLVQEMGFTVIPYSHRLGHFGEFWENLYSWLIIWAFNPSSLPSRSLLELHRSEMWMGREAFIQRFSKFGERATKPSCRSPIDPWSCLKLG